MSFRLAGLCLLDKREDMQVPSLLSVGVRAYACPSRTKGVVAPLVLSLGIEKLLGQCMLHMICGLHQSYPITIAHH